MVDKTFGTHTGTGSARVQPTDIYDLASLSKTTGTVLALMKLYDKGRFNLTDRIADYLPFLQRTNKKDITIQELLYHQSGLPPGIAFYREAIDEDSYEADCSCPAKMHGIRCSWELPHGRILILHLKRNMFQRLKPEITPCKSVIVCG